MYESPDRMLIAVMCGMIFFSIIPHMGNIIYRYETYRIVKHYSKVAPCRDDYIGYECYENHIKLSNDKNITCWRESYYTLHNMSDLEFNMYRNVINDSCSYINDINICFGIIMFSCVCFITLKLTFEYFHIYI